MARTLESCKSVQKCTKSSRSRIFTHNHWLVLESRHVRSVVRIIKFSARTTVVTSLVPRRTVHKPPMSLLGLSRRVYQALAMTRRGFVSRLICFSAILLTLIGILSSGLVHWHNSNSAKVSRPFKWVTPSLFATAAPTPTSRKFLFLFAC